MTQELHYALQLPPVFALRSRLFPLERWRSNIYVKERAKREPASAERLLVGLQRREKLVRVRFGPFSVPMVKTFLRGYPLAANPDLSVQNAVGLALEQHDPTAAFSQGHSPTVRHSCLPIVERCLGRPLLDYKVYVKKMQRYDGWVF